jgi:hypothetical protein
MRKRHWFDERKHGPAIFLALEAQSCMLLASVVMTVIPLIGFFAAASCMPGLVAAVAPKAVISYPDHLEPRRYVGSVVLIDRLADSSEPFQPFNFIRSCPQSQLASK